MNKPDKVVLHCAYTPDSTESIYSIDDIRRWHIEDNGWSNIGYHWYLTRDGLWHRGREENVRGAHAGKIGNTNSLGLCYEGTWKPTNEQISGLICKYRELKDRYGITSDQWWPHYRYKPGKTCPGFSIELLRALFRAEEKRLPI